MSPDDPSRVAPLIAMATAHGLLGRVDEKIALEDEVLAALARLKVKPENLAIVLTNRGHSEAARGRWAAALAYHDRSIAVYEEIESPTHPMLIFPLEARGRALVTLRRPAEALATLERAVALEIPGRERREQASAGFLRGRARVESRGDRAAGLAEARAGLAAMNALAPDHPDTRAAAAWLARRR
jgi:tetratricopeptide (TPR) repeat protein